MVNGAAPTISVCVPTYNGEDYLAACLESVFSQTCGDWELVIVDDCSTDGTLKIAESYAIGDSRVRIERNRSNLGLVSNWNHCIRIARGRWLKFLFQDDLLEPDCLSEMLGATGDSAQFIVAARDFIFAEDVPDETRQFYLEHPSLSELSGMANIPAQVVCEKAIELPGINFIGEPSSVLMRSDLFARFGLFDPRLIMICDTEYWVRVASHTGLIRLPHSLSRFRVHGRSTSARNFATRQYRMALDGLLLLWLYAYDERYEALRTFANSRTPPVNFGALIGEKAVRARRMAIEQARRGNFMAVAEWNRFVENCAPVADALADSDLHDSGLLASLSRHIGEVARKMWKH